MQLDGFSVQDNRSEPRAIQARGKFAFIGSASPFQSVEGQPAFHGLLELCVECGIIRRAISVSEADFGKEKYCTMQDLFA
jgi:hypothetical protein